MTVEQSSIVTGPSVVTRRRFAGILGGGALAAVASIGFARAAGAQEALGSGNAPTGNYVTVAALNLRESASTSARVLAVIPAGTALTTYSGEQNGFRSTVYKGLTGWVAVAYLQNAGNPGSSDGPNPNQDFSTKATVLVPTNFRTSANTSSSSQIIATLPANTVVGIGTQVVNGFRAVAYNGRLGWMIDSSLRAGGPAPAPGGATGPAYINAPANFRMDPSYGNNIIRVLPAGTTVTRSGRLAGDFIEVSTPGDIGWVFKGLVTAGAPSNPGTPGGSPIYTFKTTAALNFRADASSTASLLTVIPAGATVTGPLYVSPTGYAPVNYKGRDGWVLAQYIVRA